MPVSYFIFSQVRQPLGAGHPGQHGANVAVIAAQALGVEVNIITYCICTQNLFKITMSGSLANG